MVEPTSSQRKPRRLAFVEAVTRGTDAGLVLADDAGSRYLLGVDQDLIDAIRTMPVSKKQTPQPASDADVVDIGPREIQAMIRAGMAAAEIARVHNLDVQRVQRYEGPVLAERAWMAERAQQTELRRPEGSHTLVALVSERLSARGDDLASLEWDAWRRDDHRWVVEATWLALGTQLGDDSMASARWVFDPVGHTVVPEDAPARALVEDLPKPTASRPQPKRSAGGDPYQTPVDSPSDDLTALARATNVTTDDDSAASSAVVTPEPAWTPIVVEGGKAELPEVTQSPETEAPSVATARELTSEPVDDAAPATFEFDGIDDVPEPVTPASSETTGASTEKKGKKSGRARIPSWDEILLGTQGAHDQS